MLGRELAKLAVTAEQDTAGMAFRKRKGKAVMNREPGAFRTTCCARKTRRPAGR